MRLFRILIALLFAVICSTSFGQIKNNQGGSKQNTTQLENAGKKYLAEVITKAKSELIRDSIKSLTGNSLAAHSIPTSAIFGLAPIEHTGCDEDCSGVIYTTDKFFERLGKGKSSAFNSSRSHAGAIGLFQMKPATYQMVRRLYPSSNLHKNSIKGLADHVASAKAAILLSDYHLSLLTPGDRSRFISDPNLFRMYLASAYNAGAGGLVKRIVQSGKNLYNDNPSNENKQYIHKMLAVSQRYS